MFLDDWKVSSAFVYAFPLNAKWLTSGSVERLISLKIHLRRKYRLAQKKLIGCATLIFDAGKCFLCFDFEQICFIARDSVTTSVNLNYSLWV